MAEDYLPTGEHQSLHRRKFRHVSWLLKDMKGLKESPQRVRLICESTVRERVAGEKVTEFVVD
jgi:hypothetical protein